MNTTFKCGECEEIYLERGARYIDNEKLCISCHLDRLIEQGEEVYRCGRCSELYAKEDARYIGDEEVCSNCFIDDYYKNNGVL